MRQLMPRRGDVAECVAATALEFADAQKAAAMNPRSQQQLSFMRMLYCVPACLLEREEAKCTEDGGNQNRNQADRSDPLNHDTEYRLTLEV